MKLHKMYKDRLLTTTRNKDYYDHYHILEINEKGHIQFLSVNQGPEHVHAYRNGIIEKEGTHDHELSEHTKQFLKNLIDKKV